ncbi:hypothetical protein GP5015_1598 [gamma proteobacterium HTCC5015]|nr:hypothetical protein GP5015_1598 [gamma proteobacterium HTCC5015]
MNTGKWPRHWAAEILQLPTREQRKAHLQKVPEHLRDWVEHIVKNEFELRNARKRSINESSAQS